MRARLEDAGARAAVRHRELRRARLPGQRRADWRRTRQVLVGLRAPVDDRGEVVADLDRVLDREVVRQVRDVPEHEDDEEEPEARTEPGPCPAVRVEQAEDGTTADRTRRQRPLSHRLARRLSRASRVPALRSGRRARLGGRLVSRGRARRRAPRCQPAKLPHPADAAGPSSPSAGDASWNEIAVHRREVARHRAAEHERAIVRHRPGQLLDALGPGRDADVRRRVRDLQLAPRLPM